MDELSSAGGAVPSAKWTSVGLCGRSSSSPESGLLSLWSTSEESTVCGDGIDSLASHGGTASSEFPGAEDDSVQIVNYNFISQDGLDDIVFTAADVTYQVYFPESQYANCLMASLLQPGMHLLFLRN